MDEEAGVMVKETTTVLSSASPSQPSAVKLNRRLLKKKKKLVLQGKGTINDYFDVYGAEAKAEVVLQPPVPNSRLKFKDLQGLVRWVLADGDSPKWVFIKNKPLVTKVVMLHLPGMNAAQYVAHPAVFKNLTQCCGNPRAAAGVSPLATTAQTVEAIFSCPKLRTKKNQTQAAKHAESGSDTEDELVGHQRPTAGAEECSLKRRKVENCISGNRQNARSNTEGSFPASYYTLTARQMHENGYPKADSQIDGSMTSQPGFVRTHPAGANKMPLEMVAVDCEMCYTCKGLELTRVSMVDKKGIVILDRLVKPENPIVDYNTRYSGITAAMMADVTTSLADVQEEILQSVQAETILVGHSVENDLLALKIVHPLVIDTALLYHHPTRGPMCKPALRILSARFLKRNIQGDKAGHDSVEDARAAMDLALLKIRSGPGFGKRMKPNCESLIEVLGRHGRRCTLIDRRPMLHQYAVGSCNAIVATSDDDVFAKAVKEVKKSAVDFVWAQFTELSAFYEDQARRMEDWSVRLAEMAAMMTCNKRHNSSSVSQDHAMQDPERASTSSLSKGLETVLIRMNDRAKMLYEALPLNTLLIVVTGHGDTASVRRLQELKWKSLRNKQPVTQKWSETNEAVLEEFGVQAETALAFTCIK